ncbi:hypothetical protein [Dactylosporangium sp. CA-139066]|uniref:hypothetical protein n=1 Tax=Dactylosporangium sp. CA-139066 TaxID=3239930 RepID=UPI003D8FA84C
MRPLHLIRLCLLPLLLVLSLGGCGWAGRHDEKSKPDGILIHGYVSVAGAAAGVPGTPCLAPSSVPDIVEGGTVKAADEGGRPIAATTLAGGVLAQNGSGYNCNFAFELRNLPGARPTYLILVGTQPATPFDTKELREGRPAVINVSAAPATASSKPS